MLTLIQIIIVFQLLEIALNKKKCHTISVFQFSVELCCHILIIAQQGKHQSVSNFLPSSSWQDGAPPGSRPSGSGIPGESRNYWEALRQTDTGPEYKQFLNTTFIHIWVLVILSHDINPLTCDQGRTKPEVYVEKPYR